jgi:hypothetical protein
MATMGLYCCHIVSLQELNEIGFFFQVVQCLGIECLHLVEFVRDRLLPRPASR